VRHNVNGVSNPANPPVITNLAKKFHMTLTGMKKHVGVLEQAGLVTTEKVGRVRTCKLGPRRLETPHREETVEAFVEAGNTVVRQDGTWSVVSTVSLSQGRHAVTSLATDAAGNSSEISHGLFQRFRDLLPLPVQFHRLRNTCRLAARTLGLSKEGTPAPWETHPRTAPTHPMTASARGIRGGGIRKWGVLRPPGRIAAHARSFSSNEDPAALEDNATRCPLWETSVAQASHAWATPDVPSGRPSEERNAHRNAAWVAEGDNPGR